MAKTPTLKQQLLQEIANQQVAQFRQAQQNNDDIAQLQAQYDAWQNQQEVNSLQAQYDAWVKEQTPAQPAQTAPVQTAPVVKPVVQKLPTIDKEAYQRQQQEEQMLAGNNPQRLAKEKAIKQNATNETLNRLGVMSQIDLAKTPSVEAKATRWLDPNYKLTNEDKTAAKEYAQSELDKFTYNSARQPVLKSAEDRQHYADMVNLLNKTNPVANAMTGVLKQPLNLAKAVRDAGRSVGNQITGLGAAIGDKTGITEGATQRHNEKVAAADNFYNQNDESMQRAYEGAKTQNPAATTVGEIGGQLGMYMLTNPLFDSLGAVAGLGKAGSFALNQVGQNLQDVALDTLPTLNQYANDGEITEEERNALLSGMGWNAAGNLAVGGLGLGWDALKQNKAAKNAADAAFRTNVSEGAEKLARLADTGYEPPVGRLTEQELKTLNTNPVEANNNQFRSLMDRFNSQFKDESAMKNIYSPEDLDASQNAQLKALMEENLIPERVNPVAEMKGLEESYANDELIKEISEMNDEMGNLFTPEVAENVTENVTKATPKKLELPEETEARISSDLQQLFGRELNHDAIAIEQLGNENVTNAYKRLEKSLFDYMDSAFKAEDIEDVKAAKRAVNSARKNLERVAKREAPDLQLETTKYAYGKLVGQPEFRRTEILSPDESLTDDMVQEWLDYDKANEPNKWVRGAGEEYKPPKTSGYTPEQMEEIASYPQRRAEIYEQAARQSAAGDVTAMQKAWDFEGAMEQKYPELFDEKTGNFKGLSTETKAAPKQGFNGQYNMQTFAEGPEDRWATSKLRTNSMEKTGLIKNPDDAPVKDYSYRVYGGAEQNADFDVRYADSKDVVRDLVEKDAFDEVDMRGAARQWRELMQSGDVNDIRKATRLSHKMDVEGREGGRLIEAIKEMNKNTPDGQLQDAQSAIGQAIDKRRGKGTSESLNNLYDKLSQAYEDATSKEDFLGKAKDLIKGDLKRYASPKTAKQMKSKNIRGLNDIIKMIDKAEDLSDVPFDKIVDVMYKANGGVTLSPAAQKEIYDILVEASNYKPESYENRVLLAQAARKVMAEMPSGVGDWIRAFLYDNMLGNFKTAFSRNFFGNVSYQSLEKLRELPTAAVDKLVSVGTGKRSALGWNKAKARAYKEGFKKGGIEQLKDTFVNKVATTRSGQISWEDALKENRTIHNDNKKLGHLANEIDRYVEAAMKFGDRPIYEANYAEFKTELEQMVDRFGKNGVAGLENVKDEELQEVIDDIAAVRAADAVFQKQGKMSEGLTKLRDGLGELSQGALGVDVLSTASAPFTLTPGNMLERAIEYTPIGAFKNAAETAKEVLGGTGFDQRRFVEEAGRTITGLPVLGAAYFGAKNGLINGGYSTDPDEKQAQIDDGYIEYGFNVPENTPLLGGKTLDTSDLPVYGPFMQAGSVFAENVAKNKAITPDAALQAAEAVAGSSALQGIRRAFGADSSSYSSQNSVVDNLKNTVMSSGSQFIPSLMRQTAQTTDKYKRDLGEYGTNEYYLNMIKNNIPGVRETLPIKTDVEGEPILQNQGRNALSKVLENYVLPMNMSEYEPSELNQEASRLLDKTDKNWAFQPKALRSDVKKWDEKIGKEFTEDQFRRYKEDLGKKNANMGNALLKSNYYSKLDDEGKVAAMQSVYSAMKALAKEGITGEESDDKIVKAYKKNKEKGVINYLQGNSIIEEYGISKSSKAAKQAMELAEKGKFYEARKVVKDYAKWKEIADEYDVSDGTFISSDSAQQIKDMIADGNVSGAKELAKQQSELKSYGLGTDSGLTNYNKAKESIPGLTTKDFATAYKSMDANGKGGISQTELVDYLNANHISEKDMKKYWTGYGKSDWKKIPYLKNGVWYLPKK